MNSTLHRIADFVLVLALAIAGGLHLAFAELQGRTTVLVLAAVLNMLLVSVGVRLVFAILYGLDDVKTFGAVGTLAACLGALAALLGELSGVTVAELRMGEIVREARDGGSTTSLPFGMRLVDLRAQAGDPVLVLYSAGVEGSEPDRQRLQPGPQGSISLPRDGAAQVDTVYGAVAVTGHSLEGPPALHVLNADTLWQVILSGTGEQFTVLPKGDTVRLEQVIPDRSQYLQAVTDNTVDRLNVAEFPCDPGAVVRVSGPTGTARYLVSDTRGEFDTLPPAGDGPLCPDLVLVPAELAAVSVLPVQSPLPRVAVRLTTDIPDKPEILLVEGCGRSERAVLPSGDTLRMHVGAPSEFSASVEMLEEQGGAERIDIDRHSDRLHGPIRLSLIGCRPREQSVTVRVRRSPRDSLGMGAVGLMVVGLVLVLVDILWWLKHRRRYRH